MLSSSAHPGLEAVAKEVDHPKFFQLYIRGDADWVDTTIKSAVDHGYRGIALTVDHSHNSRRDRDVAKDILGGICDLGPANSYYVGLMRSGKGGPEQVAWGKAIKVILPTFEGGGTQVNVSGAALAKHAPNKAEAMKLIEFLVSDRGQKLYAEANYEYPVKAGVEVDPIIAELGTLKVDPLSLEEIARQRKRASELVDKVGFDG